jgi:hypothetical protein
LITISNILLNSNNYNILSYAYTSANITSKSININPLGINKVYDKNYIAQFTYTISGIVNGDETIDIVNYYANFNDYNVGINLITISNILLNNNRNYNILSYAYTTGIITSIPININPRGLNKVYDKTYIAQFTYTISGIISGDSVNIVNYYANFNDYNSGTNILITISNILLDNSNYNILSYAYTLANIYKRFIYPTTLPKIYDKTTKVNLILNGIINDDIIDYTANFIDYKIGSNKEIIITIDNNNYQIFGTLSGTIITRPLTLIPTILTKYYDKTNTALFSYTLSGIVSGDLVDISSNLYSAKFVSFNSGVDIPVTISNIILYQQDSFNYSILTYYYTTGTINKKFIYGTAQDKIYDQTNKINISISNVINGDLINYYSELIGDYNVGLKSIYITLSGDLIYVAPAVNTDLSLKYYYTFNTSDTSGLRILNRATGIYDGLLSNASAQTNNSIIGDRALTTNNGTTWLTSSYISNFTNIGLSITLWVYFTSSQTGAGHNVFSITTFAGSGNSLMMELGCATYLNHIYLYVYGNSNASFTGSIPANTYRINTWIHISIVLGSSAKCYLNGQLITTQSYTFNGITWTSGTQFTIGADSPSNNFWLGQVDDFRIYNKMLSVTEVQDIYNYRGIDFTFNNNYNYQFFTNIIYTNIFKKTLDATFYQVTKTYDGTTNAYLSLQSISGYYFSDYDTSLLSASYLVPNYNVSVLGNYNTFPWSLTSFPDIGASWISTSLIEYDVQFQKLYNNTSLNNIYATLYYNCDFNGELYLNGIYQNQLNYSPNNYSSLNIIIQPGINLFEFRIINNKNNVNGLIYTVYDGFFGTNVNFFDKNTNYKTGGIGSYTGLVTNISSINAGTNGYIQSWQYFSIQWLGYFVPDVTGLWTFWTNSDDASCLWIGSTADSGYTRVNALIDNPTPNEKSGTINLIRGVPYSIRIQFGETWGGYRMIVSFQGPTGSLASTRTTNGYGFFFNGQIISSSLLVSVYNYNNNLLFSSDSSWVWSKNVPRILYTKKQYLNNSINVYETELLNNMQVIIPYNITISDYIPTQFQYIYTNLTGSSINSNIYINCDYSGNFYMNGNLVGNLSYSLYNNLTYNVEIPIGDTLFEFDIVSKNGLNQTFNEGILYNIYNYNNNTTRSGIVFDISNINNATNNTLIENYLIEFFGYIKIQTSGNYSFNFISNDYTYFWLGSMSISGYTFNNLTYSSQNNGYLYNTIYLPLNTNTLIPFRLQYLSRIQTTKLNYILPLGLNYTISNYIYNINTNNTNDTYLSLPNFSNFLFINKPLSIYIKFTINQSNITGGTLLCFNKDFSLTDRLVISYINSQSTYTLNLYYNSNNTTYFNNTINGTFLYNDLYNLFLIFDGSNNMYLWIYNNFFLFKSFCSIKYSSSNIFNNYNYFNIGKDNITKLCSNLSINYLGVYENMTLSSTIFSNLISPQISNGFLFNSSIMINYLYTLINNKPPWGIYAAELYNNNVLYEARGNGRNATCSGVILTNGSGNGASVSIPYLYGSTTSKIDWPNGSIPTNFTVCSITRYNGSNRKRILNGKNINWLHGHYEGTRGVAFYNNWINITSKGTIDNWVVACGKNSGSIPNNFMVDGIGVATSTGGLGNDTLSINSRALEYSDWAFSHVLIWDQALTDDEMLLISNYLLDHLLSGISIIKLLNINYNPPIGTYFYNTGFTNSLIVSAINTANNQLLFKSNKNWKSTIGQPIKLLTDFYLKSYIANYITATNGTNIPITISNIVLGGTNNYTLRIPTLSGTINKATLIVNITSIKTYDKTLYAPFTSYTLSGLAYIDLNNVDLSNIPILSHNTYDISSSYMVNVGPIILKGSNAFNYNLISNVFATINPKQLIPYNITKVYDTLNWMYLSLSGTISGDLVSAIGYFDSNNSGNRLVYVNLFNSNITLLSFGATTNPFPYFGNNIISYVYSGDGKTCVIAGWYNYIYFSKYTNGSWSSFTQTLDTNTRPYYSVSLNYDGSILVSTSSSVYYSYWNGRNYTAGTLVGSGLGAYISPLTNFLVIKVSAGRVYWSNWTGNGFTVPVVTPDPASSGSEEMGVTVSKDNQRIVFCSSYVYWADWNGTNFNLGKQINDSNSRQYKSCRITTDKNVIFVITLTSSNIYYSIWNNKISNYGPLIATNIISGSNFYGLDLSFDDSTLYTVPWANGTFYKSTVTYYYGYNNYTTNTTVSGIITKANLIATGVNKIYDNTNTSKFTLAGYYDSDLLTISNVVYNSLSYYNSIYVGNNIPMTLSSIVLENYQISNINAVSGSIIPRLITSNFVGIDKIYDTTTNCQVEFISLSGIYLSDLEYVSLSNTYTSVFISSNSGLQEISITGLTLYKSLAYNYNVYNISNSNLINLKNLLINKPAWGIYSAESFNNNILYDLTNNNRNAICTGVTLTNGSGNGASASIPYLYGSTTSKIIWTNGSIPTNFTICSITRYAGPTQQYILSGKNTNWGHGHIFSRGNAFYGFQYLTLGNIGNAYDWLVACGKNTSSFSSNPNNFIADGVGVARSYGPYGNDTLTINNGLYNYNSDWAFSHVLIWDQNLTDSEMFIVSNFLLDHLSKNISLKSLDLPLYANILPKNIIAYGVDKYYDGNDIAQLSSLSGLISQLSSISGLINIDRTDLISYYPFNGNILNYASGIGVLDGNLKGATLSTFSKRGIGSLKVEGQGSNFNLPYISANTKGYTFAFWIYLNVANWSGAAFAFHGGGEMLSAQVTGNVMEFVRYYVNTPFPTIKIPPKTWTHFAWTLTTSSVSNIYINGLLYTTTRKLFYTSTPFDRPIISGTIYGQNYGINGYIDEFIYYNRILNQFEIESLYNYNLQESIGIFATKNVGSNILINILNNIPLSINGTNYIINNSITTANILQKPINNIINTKVYDGTNIGTYSLSGIVYGDNVSILGSVLLSNTNVGPTILTICGYLDNPNYILQSYNYPFTILQKQIIPIFNVKVKVYDKITTNPVITYTLSGIVLNDINNVDICNNFIGIYKSINYGYAYVDISNITLYGLQSINYYINSIATVLTYINKYDIYGYPLDKIYDGTTTLLLNISGLLPDDTITYIANYNTKNVGTNNLLPATTDGPYNIIYSNTTANILPLLITTTITSNKVYDGLPNITLNFTLSGILTIDDPVLFTYLQPNYSVSTIGNYGIYPWSTDSNFIDISAQWIWTISGASTNAPLNSIGYQFQYLFTNTTNNIINATVHLLADDICNFYLNGKYINSAIIGSYTSTNYSKININIPLGTSIFEFESFNLGSFPNSAGILVSVLDYNNNILFRTDNSWVYSINVKRSEKYNSLIYVSNYHATISSIIENTFIAYYYGLTLSGPNSSNYYVINDGFYYGTFTNITLNATFYCNQKIYDKIIKADVTYSLDGILPEHIGGVDICSNYIAQYRHYNSSNFSNVDITNISLYGQNSKFYNINSSSLTTTSIDQRYLFIINGDKQYDKTVYAYLTLSNNIIGDTIIYSANFDDYYVGSNKIINITLSNTINESINNLLYKLSTYYTFNNGTINNQYIANYGNYNVVYDALLSKNINIDTSGMKIESGCLTLNYSNQEYLILPNNLTDNNGLTFSFWFKANNTPSGSKIFELSNGNNDNIYFGIYNNYIYCGVYNEISQDYFNFYTVDLNNNQWYYVVWILQTDNVWLIYVNNILVNTNTSALYPNAKLRTTNFIGKYFNGSIDDFRIYNRCLSNDDISNIYNNNVFNLSNSNYLFYQNTFYGSIFQKVVQVLGIPVIYNSNNTVTLYFTNKIETDNIDICNNYIANYINFNAQKNIRINYNNLKIYGNDTNSYICSISGITYGDINPVLLQVTFETKKYYDKNQYYTVYYTISGYYNDDAKYVTISNSIYGLFRSNLAGLTQLDISNIYLVGPYPSVTNYYLPYNKLSLSGYIYQKFLDFFVSNKIYDRTSKAYVTVSGIVDTDFVGYDAQYTDNNGQYTDYNAGQNKNVYITLGQYLNITSSGSIYCPVITGFGPSVQPWTSGIPNYITGMAMNSDQTRMVLLIDDFMYFSVLNNGTWSAITRTLQTSRISFAYGLALTADGSRGVLSSIYNYTHYFTWTGNNYSQLIKTLDDNFWISAFSSPIDITSDGSRIVVSDLDDYIYYADWNGTNYNPYIQILDTNRSNYTSCAITSDGDRIACIDRAGYIYLSFWDGTNYGKLIKLETYSSLFTYGGCIKFSSDKKYIFAASSRGTKLFYLTWNGFTYCNSVPLPESLVSFIDNPYGLCVFDDYIYITSNNTLILKIAVQSSLVDLTKINNNLLFHYTMDANTINNNKLYNNITKTYDATLYNNPIISTTDYRVGSGSMIFDSTSYQYIQIPSFTSDVNGMSFSMWFKSNNSSNWSRIFSFGNGSNRDIEMFIFTNILMIKSGTVFNNATSNINDNKWRHIAWIINSNGTTNFYLDGINIYTTTITYPQSITRDINYIGKSYTPSDPYFNGSIDDFRVYNRVLTISEVVFIRAQYNDTHVSYYYSNDYLNYQVLPNYFSTIYQKDIIFNYNSSDKTYDGTNAVYGLKVTISGIINGDIITLSSYIAYYDNPNVGYQLITISNIIFGGKDIINYKIDQSGLKNYGFITQKSLLIFYNPTTTIYSGYLFNLFSVSYNGFVLGENSLALSGSIKYTISLNTNNDIRNTYYNNQVNYVIGGNKKTFKTIGYSFSGITWYNATNNPFSNNCFDIETDNKIWVAVGESTNTIAYSNDGIIWTGLGIDIFSLVGYGITYYNNKWIAVGQGINSIATSTDGINWTGLGTNVFNIYGKAVKSSKYISVAIGQGSNTLAYSYNGNIWIGLGRSIFNIYGNDILFNGALWLALGKGTDHTMAYSFDGINWVGLGKSIFTDYAKSGDWDGNKWIVVGSGTNTLAYSYDGIIWTGLGTSIFSDFGSSVAFDGTKWYGTGNTSFIFVSSNNGLNWTTISNSLDLNYGQMIKCKKSVIFYEQAELINYGNYYIKPTGYYSNNYKIAYFGDYTYIQKAPLIIEPYTYNKNFDGILNYDYGIFYTGFKGDDSPFNLLGSINYISNAKSDVGIYNVTISGLYALNYNINNKISKITIIKAPLIIKANNYVKIYDASPYTPSYSILGIGAFDTNFSLSGQISFSGTYLNSKNVGTYTIIPSGFTSKNYDIKFLNGTLQITKTPLMVIAKDDSRIYTIDISNYLFVYTRENYLLSPNYNFTQTTNTIQSLINFTNYDRVWTLEGYDGPCELKFDFIDFDTIIGLSELNYKTNITNYMKFFLHFDVSGNLNIMENNYYNYIGKNNVISNYKIKFDGTNITYYKNNTLLRTTNKNQRIKLYVNILIKNKNTRVFNLQFNNIKEYYYGGNGLIFEEFKGNDTYLSLSGYIIYGGTSQGATDEGTYSIVPSGFLSNNYDIRYITGVLKIKKSILSSPYILPNT